MGKFHLVLHREFSVKRMPLKVDIAGSYRR